MNEHGPRYESAVDRAIREAQERGEFDNLPGKGKPLPGLDGPDDELWWVRDYIRREGLSTEELLPESLQLRKQIERVDEAVAGLPSERAVRDHVHELNRQIRRARIVPSGPPVVLRLVDPDQAVARWQANRSAKPLAAAPARTPAPAESPPARRRSWWRGLGRRAARPNR
ncbi:MAG TPA: DUF1992 domain-containing protein [Pseudonocardia sp.]|uniref:DnaJ family domain-containing protein n=1 Tax=Pseudonocardia sp. TaxID=60912 RepID=UPI002EDB5DF4